MIICDNATVRNVPYCFGVMLYPLPGASTTRSSETMLRLERASDVTEPCTWCKRAVTVWRSFNPLTSGLNCAG